MATKSGQIFTLLIFLVTVWDGWHDGCALGRRARRGECNLTESNDRNVSALQISSFRIYPVWWLIRFGGLSGFMVHPVLWFIRFLGLSGFFDYRVFTIIWLL